MAPIIRIQLLAKIQHPESYLSIETQTSKTNKTIHFGVILYWKFRYYMCIIISLLKYYDLEISKSGSC